MTLFDEWSGYAWACLCEPVYDASASVSLGPVVPVAGNESTWGLWIMVIVVTITLGALFWTREPATVEPVSNTESLGGPNDE